MKKLIYEDPLFMQPVFDEETLKQLMETINTKHSSFLKQESFFLEAFHNPDQIQLKMTLKGEHYSYPLECVHIKEIYDESQIIAIEKDSIVKGDRVVDKVLLILDYLDFYFYEYFVEERNVFVSLDWTLHHFHELNFYLRGFIRYDLLEGQADHFLKQHGHGDYAIEPISSDL